MPKSYITSAITSDGSARIIFADTKEITGNAINIHSLTKTSTAALGRSLTAASLMGYTLKNDKSSLTLQFKGDGPIGSIICVSDYKGNVRGYCDNPGIDLPPNKDGKIDVSGAVGKGIMYVIKDMGLENPYIGQCAIVSGEIAEDITSYYASSEQVPTVCALGVRVNRDLSCKSSGGFLMQLLPFADENIIPKLEENISKISSVSALLAEGKTGEEIIDMVFSGIEHEMFDQEEISFKCSCSRDKYKRAIMGLSKDDLEKLREDGTPVEAVCSFCGKKYTFKLSELLK